MAAVVWFLALFTLISGYDFEKEQERMCMHLASSLNWNNYRPIADTQKRKEHLDKKRLEERITWDAFLYCKDHITKPIIDEIRGLDSVPNSKFYMEFLKWDESKYNTDEDLEIEPELFAMRERIFRWDAANRVMSNEEEDKKLENARKFEEVKADILAGKRNM